MSKILPFQHVIYVKVIKGVFYIFIHTKSSKFKVYFIPTTQRSLDPPHLKCSVSHMWLMAITVDSWALVSKLPEGGEYSPRTAVPTASDCSAQS